MRAHFPFAFIVVSFFAWVLAWLMSVIQASRDSAEGGKIFSFIPFMRMEIPKAERKKEISYRHHERMMGKKKRKRSLRWASVPESEVTSSVTL